MAFLSALFAIRETTATSPRDRTWSWRLTGTNAPRTQVLRMLRSCRIRRLVRLPFCWALAAARAPAGIRFWLRRASPEKRFMSTTPPNPTPTLSDAITAAEQAGTAYQTAVTTTANDQSAAAAIQAKLDAANATVATDQQNQMAAATSYNTTLTTLIAAAQAAMIPVADQSSGS